jgi:DNA-binding transcriptional MerR regulator
MRTVSEIAAAAGVSVRTLHHYDEIGLLRPQDRTDAGYRLYGDPEVRRLHEIVFWRSLGFPLDEVRALLDEPGHDALESMRLHRDRLVAEHGRITARIEAVDVAIARAAGGAPLTNDDLVVLFEGFEPSAYEAEVEQRWGDSPEWVVSKRRTAQYGKEAWERIKREGEALNGQLAALCRSGVSPDAAEARGAAAAHRAYIDRWFYPVSAQVHLALADGYVADARFAATYEALAPGLSVWLRDAIHALHGPQKRTL